MKPSATVLLHPIASALLALSSPLWAETPAEISVQKMKVAEGFTVQLVASEPDIRQPISISFDHRGRMWVIEYLQYPTPAGLKPVKIDGYLRTTYDKLPEPPPRGPKGADRITICEDTNGDGRMDKFKNFLPDLNLCSGMALGYDGVFLAQPPYLLYYADKNHDDIPDSDPEVLLTGFGMEDAHAFANSLTWGPDGWLYGAQGSTVTARIRGHEFQQAIWRYHPVTHAFEVFAEGGGNTWGLDFDDDGEILAGTNYHEKMLHMVQGGYYIKNFGKHGELHNPHTYGYFDHVPYSGYKGLHISIGGIVYHGGAFPKDFTGSYIFANTLDHAVYWANLRPHGSTFTATFGGTFLKTDDELFRPVDCQTGPDGAVYIADWCDKRASHVDPLDTWDRSNGRIYKIIPTISNPKGVAPRTREQKAPSTFDLTKLSTPQLADLLAHTNDWLVREARQLLAERHDPAIYPLLSQCVSTPHDPRLQLQSFWALYASGGLNASTLSLGLHHPNPAIRKWSVRFLGDTNTLTPEELHALVRLAHDEPDSSVRSQLASSTRRLAASDALPIIRALLLRNDENDPFIPLLLWWALESKAISHRDAILKLFASPEIRNASIVRNHILERLGRRYASEGGPQDLAACATLLENSEPTEQELLLAGMEKGLAGQTITNVPVPLTNWLDKAWPKAEPNLLLLCFGLRLGDPRAQTAALHFISDEARPESSRAKIIEILAQTGAAAAVPALFAICENSKSSSLKLSALNALRRFPEPSIAARLLALLPKFNLDLQSQVIDALSSRVTWTELLVEAVEHRAINTAAVSRSQLKQMTSLKDPNLSQRIEKLWGKIQSESPAEKRNFINQAKLILKPSGVVGRVPTPDLLHGKKIFNEACGICHKLYGEGQTIGPDLTGVERKNIDFLLANIVIPSAYIRPEYVASDLETIDDQTFSGLVAESTPAAVTLLDRTNQRHTIPRQQIKQLRQSPISLMPEGLLESLPPQQLIDLFGYLQAQ